MNNERRLQEAIRLLMAACDDLATAGHPRWAAEATALLAGRMFASWDSKREVPLDHENTVFALVEMAGQLAADHLGEPVSLELEMRRSERGNRKTFEPRRKPQEAPGSPKTPASKSDTGTPLAYAWRAIFSLDLPDENWSRG